MDLNADGKIDILSGCYDCLSEIDPESREMAGLFYVLWGKDKNEFEVPEILNGTDGKPLIAGEQFESDEDIDPSKLSEEDAMAYLKTSMTNFCTRPTAADLNGDGHLDLVVGNAGGTFYLVKGTGKGGFEPKSTQIMAGDQPLTVMDKSDPFIVDWDSDGDFDIVSGSGFGGVFLSLNLGTATKPKFSEFESLIPKQKDWYSAEMKLGDDHVKGPSISTRVCVDDVNGDGVLDLLVGDWVSLTFPAEGVEESEVAEKLAAWQKKMSKIEAEISPKQEEIFNRLNEMAESDEKGADNEALQMKLEKELEELYKSTEPLHEERAKIVREVRTGYIWVFVQKSNGSAKPVAGGKSLDEFKKYVSSRMQDLDEETLQSIVAAVDKDSDGNISDEEFEARFEAIRKVMQSDPNGKISTEIVD